MHQPIALVMLVAAALLAGCDDMPARERDGYRSARDHEHHSDRGDEHENKRDHEEGN